MPYVSPVAPGEAILSIGWGLAGLSKQSLTAGGNAPLSRWTWGGRL